MNWWVSWYLRLLMWGVLAFQLPITEAVEPPFAGAVEPPFAGAVEPPFTEAVEPPFTAVAFESSGTQVVAVSQSGLHVHRWPSLTLAKTVPLGGINVHAVSFSPSGKMLAVGGGRPTEEGVVEVFSWPELKRVVLLDGHLDSVRAMIWKDDQRLFSASIDTDVRVWDIPRTSAPAANTDPAENGGPPRDHTDTLLDEGSSAARNALSVVYRGHARSVAALALLPGGETLVSAGDDLSLRVWDVDSAKILRRMNQHTRPINALKVQPQNSGLPLIASASQDKTVRFWQPTIGRMVRYVRLDSVPLAIAWQADGARIVAACVDGAVYVIDPIRVQVTHRLPALDGWAYALAMHPHQPQVVVGGTNGQLKAISLP